MLAAGVVSHRDIVGLAFPVSEVVAIMIRPFHGLRKVCQGSYILLLDSAFRLCLCKGTSSLTDQDLVRCKNKPPKPRARLSGRGVQPVPHYHLADVSGGGR